MTSNPAGRGRIAGSRWRTGSLLLVVALVSGCNTGPTAPIYEGRIVLPEITTYASSPAWSPDGRRIAYSWYVRGAPSELGLWIVDTAGVVGPHVLQGDWSQADWSPDGALLAATNSWNKGIYTVQANGSGLQAISTTGSRPRWSPGGNELAFERIDAKNAGSIWIVAKDGSGLRSLAPPDTASWRAPDWSPDGTRLVHVRQPSPAIGGAIFVMDTNGGSAQRLTTDNGYMDPAWSPDGKWIAYVLAPGYIYLMKPDGTESHLLTPGESPAWSPDSRRIAFSLFDGTGYTSLYAIDIATGRIREIKR